MSTPRRPRTGARRDGQVRRIRTDEVRYPGSNVPVPGAEAPAGRRLRPARDTGIALEGRLARERRQRDRTRRQMTGVFVVALAALIVAGAGWRWSSDKRAAVEPLPPATPQAAHTQASAVFKAAKGAAVADPTPVFAQYRSMQIRLPVSADALTEVGFHQASYTYALHMTTTLPDADMTSAKKNKGTGRSAKQAKNGAAEVLGGSVLRMWRDRPGKPDSAVDVGAKPGTVVVSPVSGTIVKIKRYKLYGKYDDFELHIRPDGWKDVDLVLIHVDGVQCTVGQKVKAGVTPLATVRKLSDRIHHQLGDYSKGGGDHVHFQLNNSADPRYKGLEGAISVEDGS